jgi:hypothetical protein
MEGVMIEPQRCREHGEKIRIRRLIGTLCG